MSETFEFRDGFIRRTLHINGLSPNIEQLKSPCPNPADIKECWDKLILNGEKPRQVNGSLPENKIRILDLFSGCGGLAFGVIRGLKAAGFSPIIEAAVDLDGEALQIYDKNLAPRNVLKKDLEELLDLQIRSRRGKSYFSTPPWIKDRRLAARLRGVDVLIGGPPCQGHSNLNNHTRRADRRNELYLAMPSMAIALDVPIVIIENVREVQADYFRVVDQTRDLLTAAGYVLAEGVLSAIELGLPQTRNRFFLIGVKRSAGVDFQTHLTSLRVIEREARSLRWAIGDLENRPLDEIHRVSRLSEENVRRINWLFDNDQYDLPESERPDCHRNGHTYGAVYGRLHPERPSGTITSGFMTPGRGRFIHYSNRRTLTPLEAARIQGFPDSFRFELEDGTVPSSKTLSKVIGDAVPPVMGEEAIYAALCLRHGDLAQIKPVRQAA